MMDERKVLLITNHIRRETDERLVLALFATVIARAESALIRAASLGLRQRGTDPRKSYEVILQSHLFCGFPRMLDALFDFATVYSPDEYLVTSVPLSPADLAYGAAESEEIERQGMALIRRVYGDNYEKLQSSIWSISPEIFRLMIMDGYGKALSRPGLDIVTREFCVVATLSFERRLRQLKAHLRGAINVGAKPSELRQLLQVIGPCVPADCIEATNRLLDDLEQSRTSVDSSVQ